MDNARSATEESALVILVPEAEDLVGRYRMKYDHAAAVGVPAHITLLWPFIPPTLITVGDRKQLTELFSSYPRFETSLAEVQRFPDVLYLAPEPNDKIFKLIQLIAAKFPEYPPYGGQFDEVIPHLTIAQSDDAELLKKIHREISPAAHQSLPIHKKVTEISLLEQSIGYWKQTQTFPLKID